MFLWDDIKKPYNHSFALLGGHLGNCTYCGNPAGFFRSKHAECEQQHQQRQRVIERGKERIKAEACRVIKSTEGFSELEQTMSEVEGVSTFSNAERNEILIKAWETSVEQFLEDGILDETEEKRLVEFKDHFALSQSDLDKNGALTKTAKAAILRDVMNGVLPQRVNVDGNININFQKNEQLVWAFPASDYLEDKTKRQYVGGSRGVSVRVVKGVYYRAGAFKGQTIERTERTHLDTGLVVCTNKNIYFSGQNKSLRVPYSKVVSFLPFSDGFGILRDTATAKPQIFVTGDGWFAYNLVSNLAQL